MFCRFIYLIHLVQPKNLTIITMLIKIKLKESKLETLQNKKLFTSYYHNSFEA